MKLSPGTRRRVDFLFPRQDRQAAARLLVEECGTALPSCAECDPHGLERVRYAALKVSHGDLARLREAVALANTNWRELLVEARFGVDEHAHESWPSGKRRSIVA